MYTPARHVLPGGLQLRVCVKFHTRSASQRFPLEPVPFHAGRDDTSTSRGTLVKDAPGIGGTLSQSTLGYKALDTARDDSDGRILELSGSCIRYLLPWSVQ